jgi:hypothetical protein
LLASNAAKIQLELGHRQTHRRRRCRATQGSIGRRVRNVDSLEILLDE